MYVCVLRAWACVRYCLLWLVLVLLAFVEIKAGRQLVKTRRATEQKPTADQEITAKEEKQRTGTVAAEQSSKATIPGDWLLAVIWRRRRFVSCKTQKKQSRAGVPQPTQCSLGQGQAKMGKPTMCLPRSAKK